MVPPGLLKRAAHQAAGRFRVISALGLSFVAPGLALSFLATGPHGAVACLGWVLPMWLSPLADRFSPRCRGHGAAAAPAWVFDGTLYLLALLQVLNIVLLLELAQRLAWYGPWQVAESLMNLFAIKVVVGTSSSFSAIVVAHELLHRRRSSEKLVARLLLVLTCYEHFSTEHLRGHHRRAGTPEDAATARFGESFRSYWHRTLPAQFRSAWHLESARIGQPTAMSLRWLRHRVLQGVLWEGFLLAAIAWAYGAVALGAFLLQALAAIQKLEAVNYIEHWGLRQGRDAGDPIVAWESDSWFTLHTLLGLSLHTEHHRRPKKAYQHLRLQPESPQLPHGYFCMVFMAVWRNRRFQALMTRELLRKGRGPFEARL